MYVKLRQGWIWFYVGTVLWPQLKSLLTWVPCLLGLPDMLTVTHSGGQLTFSNSTHSKSSYESIDHFKAEYGRASPQEIAPSQANMEPEHGPLKEDSSLERTLCQVPCLFGRVGLCDPGC